MRKGCIISVIFVSFLIMLAAGVAKYYMLPRIERSGNQGITKTMCDLLAHYYRENGKWPQGNNQEMALELGEANQFAKNYIYLNRESVKIPRDQFLDAYDNPLKIEVLFDGNIEVTSAGRDGEFGTSDDAQTRINPPAYEPPEAPEIREGAPTPTLESEITEPTDDNPPNDATTEPPEPSS